MSGTAVSVVIPTWREADNLPRLLQRLDFVRRKHALDLDLIIVDRRSQDGTPDVVAAQGHDWVRLIVDDLPLAQAVLRGIEQARHDRFVVMDGDLSHPPEKIPELLQALSDGADFALGSRYVEGGSTDAQWGLGRWLTSRVATWLARPFTPVRDPMSGFFALDRATFRRAQALQPLGYKIGLELMVKCDCRRVREIPFHFSDRQIGKSKLDLKQRWLFLRHILRLWRHRLR